MLRVLIWLVELAALFALGALALASVFGRSRDFSGVMRGAANLTVGAVASVLAGVTVGVAALVGGASDPMAGALLTAILTLPLTVWVLDRRARHRARGAGRTLGAFAHRGRRALAPEPRADDAVALAWSHATRLAPLQRQRLTAAREACAYVLHWSEGHPFDMETMECAVLIRKRLPELIDQTARYCELSGRTERREMIDAMVRDCESLGRMALTRVERSKAMLGESLAATRAHIASRTDEKPAF